MADEWFSARELAGLSGLPGTVQGVISRAKKEAWTSRPRKGRGGGQEYHISSLPLATRQAIIAKAVAELSASAPAMYEDHEDTVTSIEVHDGLQWYEPDMDLALWRYSIIKPALHQPSGAGRKLAVDIICQTSYPKHNNPAQIVTPSRATVYNWINLAERGGVAALANKARADHGMKRVRITRRWDAASPLDGVARQKIEEELVRYIRSLWASGAAGWRQVQRLASVKLLTLSRAHGWDASPDDCVVSRQQIEKERVYQIVHVHDHDAKRWHDRYMPRVKRRRDGLRPGDLVFADVHPLDIALRRPDGSGMVYLRGISWQDAVSNAIYITWVLLEKREGIRREHVAQSFASMCSRSPWGMPRMLYYDNGSEYQWRDMMDGFFMLSRVLGCDFSAEPMCDEMRQRLAQDAIITAQPYNAAAKSIEGIFGVLEQQYFSQIEGWVAGDRTRKKTQNVGAAPRPFPGTMESLTGQLDLMLRAYHNTPQCGLLNNKSPNQILQQHANAGHQATRVREEALLLAFAELYQPVVRQGRVRVNGRDYRHEALFARSGKLNVRVARHDPRFAFVFDGDRLLCVAAEDRPWHILDPRGAQAADQRKQAARRQIAQMRQHCDALVLVDEHAEALKHYEITPNIPDGDEIELNQQVTGMVEALEAAVREEIAGRTADNSSGSSLQQWAIVDEELEKARAELRAEEGKA